MLNAEVMLETENTELLQSGCVNKPEDELVKRAVAGDAAAFGKLAQLYGKPLFKLAYGFFYNREDAMDVVQETSLRMYRFIGSYRSGTSFRNWVFRIATNLCIDMYRKNKRGKVFEDSIDDVLTDIEDTQGQGPEAVLEATGNSLLIKEGLAGLSKKQRTVFILKHSSGLKFREIAEVLRISEGTVKSLHHRAIQGLRKHVGRMEGSNG